MKAVTEFASFTLTKALQAKTALVAEGKTPEEILAALGTTFKLEGEKLNCLSQALEVPGVNTPTLKRILVVKLNEGEVAPAKAVQVEELHLVPEFFADRPAASTTPTKGGKPGGRKGGREGGPKGSPWGMSPEEKAAKNKKAP